MCAACKTSAYNIKFGSDSKVYCRDYCPTEYTGSKPACDKPSGGLIGDWKFDNKFSLKTDTFNSSTSLAFAGDGATGPVPAYQRGLWLGGTTAYLTNSDIRYDFSFTFDAYIRAPAIPASKMTIFSIINTTSPSVTYFSFSVKATDGNLLLDFAKGVGTTMDVAKESGLQLTTAWSHVGFSLALDNTANTSSVRFWKDGGETASTFASTEFFLPPNEANVKTTIGADSIGDTYGNLFTGFIYAFWLTTDYVETGDFPHKQADCNLGSCDDAKSTCTNSANECLFNHNIDKFDGGDCDVTCAAHGCIRDG